MKPSEIPQAKTNPKDGESAIGTMYLIPISKNPDTVESKAFKIGLAISFVRRCP